MNIELTHSEQTILKKYNTLGSEPVLVSSEDGNSYVCKYSIGGFTDDILFYEYIAAAFLKIWSLGVPDFKFVKVKSDHVDENLGLKKKYFEKVCFGSQYSKFYMEIKQSFRHRPKRFYKTFEKYKKEFLKICLFDIWMGHSDRSEGNFNVMYDSSNDNRLVPIDHQSIFFNGNIFHLNSYSADYSHSLLGSFLPLYLFSKKELADPEILTELESSFKKNTLYCRQSLSEIVKNTPEDWEFDISLYQTAILDNLFNNEWIEKSWYDFVRFYQLTINKM